MSEFKWTGINFHGEKISGKINSTNKNKAKEAIEKNNIVIISLKKNWVAYLKNEKLSPKLRLYFTQQLQLLLQAGIPLTDALSLIAKTSKYTILQTLSIALCEKITGGLSFASALSYFPNEFHPAFCRIIAAGEQSGRLDLVLTQLVSDEEIYLQTKNKLMKSLFYPASILFIAMIISVGLLIFVIPQFQNIYDNFGSHLPTLTQYFISMSHYARKEGIYDFSILVILIFVLKKTMSLQKFIWIKLPIAKQLVITKQIAQWSQLMTMTLSAGIPLIDSLSLAEQALSHSRLTMQLQLAREAVITGKPLYAALEVCRDFPEYAKTMIAIGENADSLHFIMQKIAAMYQQKLNDMLDRLSKLLEPVIMMLVASLVSTLIIAMYLPIFKMGSVI